MISLIENKKSKNLYSLSESQVNAILELKNGIIIVFASIDGKVGLAVGVTEELVDKYDAVKFAKTGSEVIGGKGGGGRKDFAQAGGQFNDKIDEAFEKMTTLI